jgi:actin related protein 2/3 complex subunit 5
MSKSTTNVDFRKVDVDQFEEEKYEEDAVIDDGVTGPNDAEVQTLLSKGRLADALQSVLNSPPIASKNPAVKDKAAQVVMKVLVAFKSADIDAAIKDLDQSKLDVLMKYIYRGFELSSDGNGYGAQLLVWHDKVFAVTGLGSIVRVLTDRRHV